MQKLFYLSVVLFIFGIIPTSSQTKQNEKLVYVGSYNMSGLMTQFAEITISSETVKTSKNSYRYLSLKATTFSKWDSFFKIRDLYESYVDPVSLAPVLYKRNILEGKYRKTEKYVFEKGKITTSSAVNGAVPVNSTVKLGSTTTDIVTAIFQLRKLNFDKMTNGQTISFRIVFDEKEATVSFKYLGKEITANKLCHKLTLVSQTNALKGKNTNFLWLTADTEKVPVLIKFIIPVGAVQVNLKN